MEVLMIILLIITVSVINIACFLIGAKIGTGKEVKVSSPVTVYREYKEKKEERIESEREMEEAKREIERLEAIERNLDRYDGTGAGQEDVV